MYTNKMYLKCYKTVWLFFIAYQIGNCFGVSHQKHKTNRSKSIYLKINYKITIDRAELISYNSSISKDFSFMYGKINKTTFALNMTFTLLEDIPDDQITVSIYLTLLFCKE